MRPWFSPYNQPSSVLNDKSTLIISPSLMLNSSSLVASKANIALYLIKAVEGGDWVLFDWINDPLIKLKSILKFRWKYIWII